LGGLVSVVLVYAWHGVAFYSVNQSTVDNNADIPQNVHHWISFLFMTFHQASVEGTN
jgi:hypothetical protein